MWQTIGDAIFPLGKDDTSLVYADEFSNDERIRNVIDEIKQTTKVGNMTTILLEEQHDRVFWSLNCLGYLVGTIVVQKLPSQTLFGDDLGNLIILDGSGYSRSTAPSRRRVVWR